MITCLGVFERTSAACTLSFLSLIYEIFFFIWICYISDTSLAVTLYMSFTRNKTKVRYSKVHSIMYTTRGAHYRLLARSSCIFDPNVWRIVALNCARCRIATTQIRAIISPRDDQIHWQFRAFCAEEKLCMPKAGGSLLGGRGFFCGNKLRGKVRRNFHGSAYRETAS
jgi:hypothetical protein